MLLPFALASFVQAEEPKCPVPKPKSIPKALTVTLSDDPRVKVDDRLRALDDLEQNEEHQDALRWHAHQLATPEAVRVRELEKLAYWRMPWLADDLDALIKDHAQPISFRVSCVKVLARREFRFDENAQKILFRTADSVAPEVKDAAVAELARLASDGNWKLHEPKNYELADKLLARALGEARPAAVVAALRAVAETGWKARAAQIEPLAADVTQPQEVRVAALEALAAAPGPKTLGIAEKLLNAEPRAVAAAAQRTRCFALVAEFHKPDAAGREAAFKALSAAGESAREALEKALLTEEEQPLLWVKALVAELVLPRVTMPIVETKGWKKLFEDPKKGEPGIKELVLDMEKKLIAADAEFVLEQGPLEFAMVSKGPNAKLHETVVALEASPTQLSTALLACGIVFAGELRDGGKVNLPKGAGVMLSVQYEHLSVTPAGETRKLVRVPIEAYIWNLETRRAMKRAPWAFTGSTWIKTDDGKMVLQAELDKTVAAIRVDRGSLLNTPLDSAEMSDFGEGRDPFYEIYRGLTPRRGTPCRVLFEPWTGEKLTPEDIHDSGSRVPPPKPPPMRPPEKGPMP